MSGGNRQSSEEREGEKHWLLSSVSSGGLALAEAKPSDAGFENCVWRGVGVGGHRKRLRKENGWKDSFFPHINALLITCAYT